jgi:hypothetical protein
MDRVKGRGRPNEPHRNACMIKSVTDTKLVSEGPHEKIVNLSGRRQPMKAVVLFKVYKSRELQIYSL